MYVQSTALTNLISSKYLKNDKPIDDLPTTIENLWIDLYERGFIEINDVFLVKRWIQALRDIGYKFPKTSNIEPSQSYTQDHIKFLSVGQSLKDINKSYVKSLNGNTNYLNSTCGNSTHEKQSLIFGMSDVHNGPRTDLPTILSHFEQRTILMGVKENETNFPGVLKDKNIKVYRVMSQTLKAYSDHSHRLTSTALAKNTEFYMVSMIFDLNLI